MRTFVAFLGARANTESRQPDPLIDTGTVDYAQKLAQPCGDVSSRGGRGDQLFHFLAAPVLSGDFPKFGQKLTESGQPNRGHVDTTCSLRNISISDAISIQQHRRDGGVKPYEQWRIGVPGYLLDT